MIRQLPSKYQVLITPMLGASLLMLLVIYSALFLNYQRGVFEELTENEVATIEHLDAVLLRLSQIHSGIHELLVKAIDERDEEWVYEHGKPLLDELYALQGQMTELELFLNIERTDPAPLRPLFITLEHYRDAAIMAIEMSTVDWKLSQEQMGRADGYFSTTIHEFQKLLSTQRLHVQEELHKSYDEAEERLWWLGGVGLTATLLMLGTGFGVSRWLGKDFSSITTGINLLAKGDRGINISDFNHNEEMRRVGESMEVLHSSLDELDRVTAETHSVNKELRSEVRQRREAEARLQLSAKVFDSSLNAIMITDAKGVIEQVNPAFTRITGFSANEAIGKNPKLLKSEQHDASFYKDLWRELTSEGHWEGEIWDRRKDGEIFPVWQSISSIRDRSGNISNYIGTFSDISEQKLSADRIYRLAHYDILTDLPNRVLYNELCQHALDRARRDEELMAVLFLDLDRFKHINDSLGHPAGDQVLKEVAGLLRNSVRDEDTVARLGGDEFVITIEQVKEVTDVERVAAKLLDAFKSPLKIEDHELVIGASIGISVFPRDGKDVATLIKQADTAMYRAKARGRNNFQFFSAKFSEHALERMTIEQELRQALERDEFILHYQPQYDLNTGALIGAEALVRWQHPKKGMIPPDTFIPIAEESGLILGLGQWVLMTACRQAVLWQASGSGLPLVSVNLSGLQLQRGDLIAMVQEVLETTGLLPACLELEILETYIMRQVEEDMNTLEALRGIGVRLAIDDFGTGQSSLGYLKRLPVGKLKIDRSFIMDIPDDKNDMAITQAILALAKSMQLTVVAEGVENKAQADFLRAHGCDQVQGYFYSPPLDTKAFEERLLLGKE